MVIIETQMFTRRVLDIFSDDEYRELQHYIVVDPKAGDIIPGSGGLRKLRWNVPGRGKRGGTRIIYYWLKPKHAVLMLFLFKKNERSDMTKDQLKKLKQIVSKEFQ